MIPSPTILRLELAYLRKRKRQTVGPAVQDEWTREELTRELVRLRDRSKDNEEYGAAAFTIQHLTEVFPEPSRILKLEIERRQIGEFRLPAEAIPTSPHPRRGQHKKRSTGLSSTFTLHLSR